MARHPLVDRRDLTAARERAPVGERPPTASPDGALAHELATLNRYLCALLEAERAEIQQLCVTDREPRQANMRNFPAPGALRIIVPRTGNGGLVALATGVPTLLVGGNEARLGGSIVVAGAGAVTLYLATDLLTPGGGAPLTEGVPQVWLSGGGGAWDFRLGNLLWCGSVIAIAAANSQVTLAEV